MNKRILAFYIRLSQEDLHKASGMAEESFSIQNQRELLYFTVLDRDDLSGYEIREFVDDGYSGTNFNRPSFQQMMAAVRNGKVQCIMVKDFSRFARNFLDMGEYLEQIFPFLGIRFISVNDHYDSQTDGNPAGDWDVVFKNFLYDLYSKDLSKKVTSAKVMKARKGEFMGRPPLGYKKSANVKNKLEIEPEGAGIVRKIFDAALEGKKIPQITELLNKEKIPTPDQIAQKVDGRKSKYKSEKVVCWSYGAVHRIIRNPVYTGACVNFKRSAIAPCSAQTKRNDKEDWIIVPGCHEAIISEEEFEKVQRECRILKETKSTKAKILRKANIFAGILVCGYCNRTMKFDRRNLSSNLYYCWTTAHSNMPVSDQVCDTRKYPADELKRIVLNAINEAGKLARKRLDQINSGEQKSGKAEKDTKCQIYSLECRINQKKKEKQDAYEQYITGVIDRQQFITMKAEYDQTIHFLETELQRTRSQTEDSKEVRETEKKIVSDIAGYAATQELTRDMVETLIDQVVVYRDNRIEIRWKFQDIFQKISLDNNYALKRDKTIK